MPYRYLDDISLADAAFEVTGKTLNEVFADAAKAVTNTMVQDLRTVDHKVERVINLSSDSIEKLLFDFLQYLVYYKDAEKLLFSKFDVRVQDGTIGHLKLEARVHGEELDYDKHDLSADVKAVTMHKFQLKKIGDLWNGMVILDI